VWVVTGIAENRALVVGHGDDVVVIPPAYLAARVRCSRHRAQQIRQEAATQLRSAGLRCILGPIVWLLDRASGELEGWLPVMPYRQCESGRIRNA